VDRAFVDGEDELEGVFVRWSMAISLRALSIMLKITITLLVRRPFLKLEEASPALGLRIEESAARCRGGERSRRAETGIVCR